MKACRHRPERHRCRGRVAVHRLDGGPSLDGEIVDVEGGGVCVVVDRRLTEGDVVRLVFPRRPGETRSAGRTMLGCVSHARTESGRQVIGIAFSRETGIRVKSVRVDHRPARQTGALGWLRRLGISLGGGAQGH
ncbi:MAG: PilZ domain-containing protein [Isosphaeraceae bacterium]